MTLVSCRSPYGGSFPCLLRFPFLVISSRRPVPVSPRSVACLACRCGLLRPSSRAICLLAVLRPASRLASRPVLPWVMPSPPCPIAPRAVRLAVIDRPALLVGWLGAGRDGASSLAIDCPSCRRCLPWVASRLRAFPRCDLLCLLACRHLCLYCDGEIVYMICPITII